MTLVEGRNGQWKDVDCFGTNSFWHERKPGEELVEDLGKETETRPQTELDAKLVVQCESPLGTSKRKTIGTELETEWSRLGKELGTVLET